MPGWFKGIKSLAYRLDGHFREELANGAGHPALQGVFRKVTAFTRATQTHLNGISFNANQLNRAMMVLLDIRADLFNQARNLFVTREIGFYMNFHC